MTTTADKIRHAARQFATYVDAAEACGMSPQTLNKYMAAEKDPTARTLRRLADGLGVSADELVGDAT